MPLRISLEEEAPAGKKIMAILDHYVPGIHQNPEINSGKLVLELTALVKEERMKIISRSLKETMAERSSEVSC